MSWIKGKGKGGKAGVPAIIQPRPVQPRPAGRTTAAPIAPRPAGPQGPCGPAGFAGAASKAPVLPPITVSGCQNVTIANIIKGSYTPNGEKSHDKPIYQKEGSFGNVSVLIYYWDERDGPNFHGWWFGPKAGGDQVWAYNGNKTSMLPPTTGWKVPWDGEVDATVHLQHGATSMPAAAAAAAVRPGQVQPRPGLPRPNLRPVNSKQLEEVKKREEEQKKRQEEFKAKREAEELARKEQAAALAVRKAVQKVRTATPENYDELRAQLEEIQVKNLEAMGSHADKVSEEATKALEQAQKRIDDLHAKKLNEAKKKQEQERLKKEMEEKVAEFVKTSKEQTSKLLAKVKEAEEQVTKLQEKGLSDTFSKDAEFIEKELEETKEGAKNARLQIMEKQKEMAEAESFKKVKREVMEQTTKLAAACRVLVGTAEKLRQTKQRLEQKAGALEKLAERSKEFCQFDKDKDGALNPKEFKAYCESKSLDLPQEILDKIMSSLGKITVEKFRQMHQKLFIAHWEAITRKKAEEEAEIRRKIEEEQQALQKTLEEVSQLLKPCEVTAADSENKTRFLIKEDTEKASDEILTEADEVAQRVEQAEADLARYAERFKEAKEELEAAEHGAALAHELKSLEQRESRARGQLSKITAALKLAREKARRKAYAEFDQKRSECATAIRAKMNSEEKSAEEFFEALNGGEALDREKFLDFLKGLPGLELFDGQREKVFESLAEEGCINKQQFKDLVRVFYKCIKATVMSEEISIKSKTLRRLEVGEVLEALAPPCHEETTRVMRVHCVSTQDELTGWVTVAGNQGTTFLEPGGNFYTCVKETVLSDVLSVKEGATIRKVTKGEVIEVLEFPKKDEASDVRRIKGKAKLDGAVGWISLQSNQGTVFMEPC